MLRAVIFFHFLSTLLFRNLNLTLRPHISTSRRLISPDKMNGSLIFLSDNYQQINTFNSLSAYLLDMLHSSNKNEVIRAVLNSLFFYEKVLHAGKAPKAPKAPKGTKTPRQKHKNENKRISDFFPLRCFLSFLITSFILLLSN